MADIYYEGVVAGAAANPDQNGVTTAVIVPNAEFRIYTVGDRTNPLPVRTLAGTTQATVKSSSLGAVPDVYVIDPSGAYSHDWVSGTGTDAFTWRRNSFDRARSLVEQSSNAAQTASSAAMSADQRALASQSAAERAAAAAANASGGAALTPDPLNPGLYYIIPGGQISTHPTLEGIYTVGASNG